ncbi:MAG: hypothetical protein J0M09_18305 [Xanthomonadales bacterium]|jgi:hypothetical protein|nr:hypothetical protein [Xanthomonadales bacterium]
MNTKAPFKAGLALVGMLVMGMALAATYSGASYIRTDGSMIVGHGYTKNTVLSSWISTQCYLVVPGWGTAATGPYISRQNTYGPVNGYAELAQQYHRGERMYATCVHRVAVNNVLQAAWWSQSSTITIP